MNRLNAKSATPLYIQLANKIRSLVDSGKLKSGDQIMSETCLIDKYKVSRITVRKAIELLVEEKVLFRKQGKGTFVAYPEFFEDACIRDRSFTASLLKGSALPHTKVLSQEMISVDDGLRKKLLLSPDETELVRISRLRYLDEQPVIYETDYFPTHFRQLLDMDLENRSLYGVLHELMQIESTDFTDRFVIVRAQEPFADYLEVEKDWPLLSVVQTVLDKQGGVVYYNEQLIKTELYEYEVKSFV